MARYGFSGSMADTKLLLLYILRHAEGSLSEPDLQDTALTDDNADYFIYADALADLLDKGLLRRNTDGRVEATERARENADIIADEIPLTLRRRILDLLKPINARIRRDRLVQASYDPAGPSVTLQWSDEDAPLITLTLAVGSEEQGRRLMRRWHEGAEGHYRAILHRMLEGDGAEPKQ